MFRFDITLEVSLVSGQVEEACWEHLRRGSRMENDGSAAEQTWFRISPLPLTMPVAFGELLKDPPLILRIREIAS